MRTIVLAILVCCPSFAFAQNGLPTAGEATGDANTDNSAAKVRVMTFGKGEDVSGESVKPGESGVRGEVHGKTSSMINIRSNFVPEILRSTDDV